MQLKQAERLKDGEGAVDGVRVAAEQKRAVR